VAGGTVQYPTNLQTLSTTVTGAALTAYTTVANGASTGFIKLGMLFDPTAANPPIPAPASVNGQIAGTVYRPVVQFFVNGQLAPTFLDAGLVQKSTFPTGWMSPVIAFGTQANSAAAYVDWIRVAQLASF
jgi:hypothetical protein